VLPLAVVVVDPLADAGELSLTIPRDRQGRFKPQLIEKYRRRSRVLTTRSSAFMPGV
jgi:hypothetical protein